MPSLTELTVWWGKTISFTYLEMLLGGLLVLCLIVFAVGIGTLFGETTTGRATPKPSGALKMCRKSRSARRRFFFHIMPTPSGRPLIEVAVISTGIPTLELKTNLTPFGPNGGPWTSEWIMPTGFYEITAPSHGMKSGPPSEPAKDTIS